MSVASESVSNSTLVSAVSRLGIDHNHKESTRSDTPLPQDNISDETINLLIAASSKLSKEAPKEQKRMYEHRLSVSQPRENRITPVSKHFTEKGHSVKDMQFSVLEWCSLKYHKPDSNHRKMREKWWMWNIGAIHPIGINQFI